MRPGHFRDVDEPLYARLQFHERAIIRQADDLAVHTRPLGVFGGDVHPGVGGLLLEPQGYSSGLTVVLEHEHFQPVPNGEHIGGMADPSPGNVGDVQQAVDAAQIQKRAVVGDIFHGAFQQLPLGEGRERGLPPLIPRFFQEGPAGNHHVAAAMIDFDDFKRESLTDQAVQVADGRQVDLRTGQKGFDPDIHHHAAFDARDHFPLDFPLLLMRHFQLIPDFHLVGFFLGEEQIPFRVFTLLNVHLDAVTDGQRVQFVRHKLVCRNDAFGFIPDVHDHPVFLNDHDPAFRDRAFFAILEAFFIQGFQRPAVHFFNDVRAH